MIERFAGRYSLLRRLGQGGMGEVFLARDLVTGDECALKRMTSAGAAPGSLRREFEALTKVRHPAVVQVHELGEAPDGTPYCTMEYVPGLPADRVLSRGDWKSLAFVAVQVCHGLEALHRAGVVHGDLKPGNLLVVPDAVSGKPASVRLLDFGLASLLGRDLHGFSGTPGYAAPEVVRGAPPSVASDLYGLGATLFTLIAGRPPFEGEDSGAVLTRQLTGRPSGVALEEVGAPPGLVRLTLRLLAAEPLERPHDAREVRQELERIQPAGRRPLAERLDNATFVGRKKDLARLESWIAAPGVLRMMVVAGEAGTGKSSLIGELAARASLSGRRMVSLSCASFPTPGGVAAAVVRRLESERGNAPLAVGIGADVEAGAIPVDERALATWIDATVAAATETAEHGGRLLILLDDAERLDELSSAVMRRLVLHPQEPPLLWVCARREDDSTSGVERVLLDAGAARLITLGTLDEGAVSDLIGARISSPAPPLLLEYVLRQAGGHPGLTVELLRSAAAVGALAEREDGFEVDAAKLESLSVPSDFEASLLARIAPLPAPARAAACALAVAGRPVTSEELRRMVHDLDDAALAALGEAGPIGRVEAGFVLRPPALGAALLATLSDADRHSLHRAALKLDGLDAESRFRHLAGSGDVEGALGALEDADATLTKPELAAAAAALLGDQRTERAALLHERAARAWIARRRYDQAVPHLERALEASSSGDAGAERAVLLSTAYLHSGQADKLARLVADSSRQSFSDGARARLLGNEAARLYAAGDLEATARLGAEALELAERAQDQEGIGVAAEIMYAVRLLAGHLDDAKAMAERAAEAHERAGNEMGTMRAVNAKARIARAQGLRPEAIRLYEEGIERARGTVNRLAIEELTLQYGWVLWDEGQWSRMRDVLMESSRIALEDERPAGAAFALASLARAESLTGDPGSARRHGRAALRLARIHRPQAASFALRSLAHAYLVSGRFHRAERAGRAALRVAARHAPTELDWCRIEYARIWLESDRASQALDICQGALEKPGSADREHAAHLAFVAIAGRAALRLGKLDDARAWCDRMGRSTGNEPALVTTLWELLATEVALASGRADEGVKMGDSLLSRVATLPSPSELGAAALGLARSCPTKLDVQAKILDWLDQATSAFQRLGDRRGAERALALTVEWLRQPGPGVPGTGDRDLIHRVSWLLNSLPDLHELTQRAMRMAVEQLDAELGVLLLADPETGALAPMAEFGAVNASTRKDALGWSRRVVQRVAESGGSLLIADAPSDSRIVSESITDLRVRSILCVPLFLGGRTVGAVYLSDTRRPHAFGEADRGTIEGFAQLMAIAIENSRGHEEVRRAKELLEGENLSLRQEIGSRLRSHPTLGSSAAMQRVMATVEAAARTNATVLITGEHGTGKEYIARLLHHTGRRRLKPFIVVNCGAIPESLIESELFGILDNVATGVRARQGKFVHADGGTLFLDEIGEMPLSQQVALLQVIANREITHVGSAKAIPIDVRIIAATNKDLRRLVDQGGFREDLYYRLNIMEIEVPPLRDRKADILALAKHFLHQSAQAQGLKTPEMAPDLHAALMQSDWPGNVRELQNYAERLLAMNPGPILHPQPLPRDLEQRTTVPRQGRRRLHDAVGEIELRLLREALERSRGNQSHAARELGLTEQAIRYRIRKYGIAPSRVNRRTRQKQR